MPILGLLGLAGLAFLVLASYEVARPAVELKFRQETGFDPSLLDTVLGDDGTRGRDRARDDDERTARRPRDLTEEVLELPGALLGE